MKLLYFSVLLILSPILIYSQVGVDINSGDPDFPFPQFLAYEYDGGHILENLANQNADGLVHAEMEKRIREAWLIMSNRFAYDGDSHAGVQYIQSNLGCPYDCSEGAGYAMIAAAYMADKTSFDGIWFREHDIRLVKHPRYRDGVVPRPGYLYGENALAEPGGDSATDGDVDIALGLLMAWKQWGDDSGYLDSSGNMISYKQEALNVIRGLVEFQNQGFGDCRSVSGVVGLDGYFKNGNTWTEVTNWASGMDPCPEFAGPQQLHVDYVAPAYCKAFADFLETEGDATDVAWNIPQLRRAEASSDWFMGELYNQGPNTIPVAGWVGLDSANNATFTNFNEGEDFRYAWRTILNHTWHGDPENSWNPTTHQVIPGGNTFNKDMGVRFSKFLADPTIAGNTCVKPGSIALTFQGPSQIVQQYNPITAQPLGAFPINWLVGTGTPSAVSAQDFDLMGKLYRQCAIEWDQATGQNLDSNPRYFHGFFRLLGMLVSTGNFQSPMNIEPEANIKVYTSVDKTAAFTGDEVTFTISYRNYGSVAAQNVIITDVIPAELEFVSATDGGVNAGGTVTWDIGTVSGFTSSGGIPPTTGEVKVTCKVKPGVSGRVCNPVTIATSSGKGWTSNDFPNEVSPVMQRNCVDIIEKALEIEKTVDFDTVNPGDIVTYSIDFKNSSRGGYINGGRSGINVAYARSANAANGTTQGIKVRLYHGAAEPYINYENYRISLFLNDNTYTCLSGEPGCGIGWGIRNNIYEGGAAGGVQVSHESIVPGSDANGAWNQRVILQFSDQLCGPTPHLLRYFGLPRIHEGGDQPLRAVWDLFTSNFGNADWSDDWSWDANATDGDDGLFYPITDDWTDPDNPIIVDRYHNEACETPTKTVNNILVEEWDGYVWRRVFGTGPVPGRDVENVVITDILPLGFTFVDFVGTDPLGIAPTTSTLPNGRTEIRWEVPRLQISQGGIISYRARADFSSGTCERTDEIQTNLASIEALNESPIISSVDVTVTCDPIILPPPPSSMTKIATPASGDVGDQVIYTLSYENTDGSPIEVGLTNASDWTSQSGTAMPVTGGSLTSVSNNSSVSTYNFSHGTNGTLEATIDFTPSAAFGFALRHTGGNIGNGLYIVFKPNPGGGSVDTRVFDGTTQIDQTILGFPGNPMDIKLLLNGDQLNVWLGNTTNPTPTWSVTGLPVRVGNYGFINAFPDGSDSFGTHTVSRFKTSMDSAFNLQITDPIPTEVSFVSASDSGVDTSGIVTYPLIPGPVLAGEIITYSWTATIDSCPASTSQIVNIGYTNILGVPTNSIAAQALFDCSGVDICATITIADPVATDATFCLNDTATDLDTFITATETIVWYAGNTSVIPITKPIVDTTVASNTTYYITQQDSNGCESNRIPIIVEVIETLPPSSTNASFCLNDPTVIDLDTFITATETVIWYMSDTPTSPPIIKPTVDTSVSSSTTYYISQEDGNGCESIRIPFLVEVIDSSTAITDAITILSSESVQYDIPLGFGLTAGDFIWSALANNIVDGETTTDTATSVIDDILINTTDVPQVVTYIITPTTTSTCSNNRFELSVTVNPLPSVQIDATSVVEGDRIEITLTLSEPFVTNIELIIDFTGISADENDLSLATQNITILAGDTTVSFFRDTTEDVIMENSETVEVSIAGIVSGTIGDISDTAIATIFDDDGLPGIIIGDATIEEGGILEVPVTLTSPAIDDITLTMVYTNVDTDNTDYDSVVQTVTFATGNINAILSIQTTDDALIENDETFRIGVASVDTGTVGVSADEGIATITDNDAGPSIIIDDASITEGGILQIPISLSRPAIDDITLSIGYTNVETDDTDYDTTNQTITILAGTTDTILSIQTTDDLLLENPETFVVSVISVDNGTVSDSTDEGIATIIDNDSIEIFISDESAEEGTDLEFSITLSRPSSEDITISFSYINETTTALDYEIILTEITIPAGEVTVFVPITTRDDDQEESDETFRLEVAEVLSGTVATHSDAGIGTIFDNDSAGNTPPLFPPYFTPNGDSFHDDWHANANFRDQILSIWIFDRQGKLLKQLSPQGTGWNGEFNGKLLPSTEYWFKAELQDGTYQQGHFSLIR